MANVLIDNVDESVSDEEVVLLVKRYGAPAPDAIERLYGSAGKAAVLLRFDDVPAALLRPLHDRLHDVVWKDHRLMVSVLDRHAPPRIHDPAPSTSQAPRRRLRPTAREHDLHDYERSMNSAKASASSGRLMR
jgi:hypothetical protein